MGCNDPKSRNYIQALYFYDHGKNFQSRNVNRENKMDVVVFCCLSLASVINSLRLIPASVTYCQWCGNSFLILNGWKHRKGYWQHIEVKSEFFIGQNYMELHSHVCLSVCGTAGIWKSTGCSGWGAVVMGAGVANYSKGISQTLGNQTPNPLCVTTRTHVCEGSQ